MLITDEYRYLNAKLHRVKSDYGAQGHKAAGKVLEYCLANDCYSILDYGCGKGTLRKELSAKGSKVPVFEYDPAIEGKTENPPICDMVVCTDVLEHVEPDLLDQVLSHVRMRTKVALYFEVHCGLAAKTLADGRNVHLSNHSPLWWKQKLTEYFDIEESQSTAYRFSGLAVPRPILLTKVNTVPCLTEDIRNDYVRTNVTLVKERLEYVEQPHDRKAIIVCYGPSLEDTWPMVKIARAYGHLICSVSGAHAFLIERGINPDVHLDCDPRPHKFHQIGNAHKDVKYWLASCVHPQYIHKIRAVQAEIVLWHVWNTSGSDVIMDEIEPGCWMVLGGGSIGQRTMSLLYCLGYRDLEIHGMDCSIRADKHYAGPHLGLHHERLRVKSGSRWFWSTGTMMSYAQYFMDTQLRFLPGCSVKLHGDGLLQNMAKVGQVPDKMSIVF